LVKRLKKMKMVEVVHKGRTTSWMMNKAMPTLQELNQRVTDWRLVPPLLDIWIYNRAQNKDIILDFWIGYLPKYPRLPLGSKSPIFGIPRIIQRCTEGQSRGILREAVPQVISVPYDPSSIEYEISPFGDANPRIKIIQEGDYVDPLSGSPARKKHNSSTSCACS
jgi:hypothetical protein